MASPLGVAASYDPISPGVFESEPSSRQPFRSRAAAAALGAVGLLGACAVLLRSTSTGGGAALDFAASAAGSQPCEGCISKTGLRSPAGASPVEFDFSPETAHFTPIYEAQPQGGNVASVNAGDDGLYVGGSGINAAFRSGLQLDESNGYKKLHKMMLAEAEKTPGSLVKVPEGSKAKRIAGELGLLGCFAMTGASAAKDPEGAIFIDVFAPSTRPLSQKNVAMVYVVGPRGGGDNGAAGFLDAVNDLGKQAIKALSAYNEIAMGSIGDLPRINVVQWPLVSGGLYRDPSVSKLEVAKATIKGMLKSHSTLLTVRFSYDHGVFEDALKEVLAPAA